MGRRSRATASTQTSTPRKKKWMQKVVGKGVHQFKRSYTLADVTIADYASGAHLAYNFALGSVPNSSEFTALFDEYKISKVKVKFMYTSSAGIQSAGNATGYLPYVYTIVDSDDSNALSTRNDYEQCEDMKVSRIHNIRSRYFTPGVSLAAYGGAFTSYANKKNQWLDCGSPNVQHYGLKMFIDTTPLGGTGSNTIGKLRMVATLYMKFRDVR